MQESLLNEKITLDNSVIGKCFLLVKHKFSFDFTLSLVNKRFAKFIRYFHVSMKSRLRLVPMTDQNVFRMNVEVLARKGKRIRRIENNSFSIVVNLREDNKEDMRMTLVHILTRFKRISVLEIWPINPETLKRFADTAFSADLVSLDCLKINTHHAPIYIMQKFASFLKEIHLEQHGPWSMGQIDTNEFLETLPTCCNLHALVINSRPAPILNRKQFCDFMNMLKIKIFKGEHIFEDIDPQKEQDHEIFESLMASETLRTLLIRREITFFCSPVILPLLYRLRRVSVTVTNPDFRSSATSFKQQLSIIQNALDTGAFVDVYVYLESEKEGPPMEQLIKLMQIVTEVCTLGAKRMRVSLLTLSDHLCKLDSENVTAVLSNLVQCKDVHVHRRSEKYDEKRLSLSMNNAKTLLRFSPIL